MHIITKTTLSCSKFVKKKISKIIKLILTYQTNYLGRINFKIGLQLQWVRSLPGQSRFDLQHPFDPQTLRVNPKLKARIKL